MNKIRNIIQAARILIINSLNLYMTNLLFCECFENNGCKTLSLVGPETPHRLMID